MDPNEPKTTLRVGLSCPGTNYEAARGSALSDQDYAVAPVSVSSLADAAMPQDRDAEASVLAAMLLSEDVLQDGLVELAEGDFYVPSNRRIFSAMRYLFDNNMPVDPVSLADHLQSTGELSRVGGRAYLVDLGSNAFALANWKHHADILRRDSTLRLIIDASSKITALAFDAPGDTKEVVDSAERLLLSVTDRDIRSNYSTLEQLMGGLYDELGVMSQNQEHTFGVVTGFKSIDRMLLGLRPGQMIVVGARPGVGKTSFALNFAVNAAAKGASVAFFSLEMSGNEIAQRLLSAQAKIGLQDIRSANIHTQQWPAILEATQTLSQLDIMVDDTPGTTVTEIRAKARRMLHGKENGLVVIDYLQLLESPSGRRYDNRATEVGEYSRGIKIMSKDLGVPVVALSQLNRGVESRTGKRPQLSDLRESGSIEQDADIVILLDRSLTEEEAERNDRPDPGVTEFIIAKNRSGPLGIVDLMFLPGSTKFVEVDTHHEE